MNAGRILLSPLHLAAVATGASSFRDNVVLGSPYLNRRGLHVSRVRLAEQVADSRRKRLRKLLPQQYREMFDELGYVAIPNALPDEDFAALSKEVETTKFPAREMKQGATVTRFMTVSPEKLRTLPALKGFVCGPLFQGAMRYVGAKNADPLFTVHTVLTNPIVGQVDPQTHLHMDTFHATSKGWLFLRDVEEEDGPFSYVPGSHRMTPGRLEWEYEQSITASEHRNGHHALGSFRARPKDVRAMGYGPVQSLPVKANTLVVADTHGFHARRPAKRASTRLAIYGSLRTSPFNPLTGPDLLDLPGLRGRRAQFVDMFRAAHARITGRAEGQPLVGEVLPGDPAVR